MADTFFAPIFALGDALAATGIVYASEIRATDWLTLRMSAERVLETLAQHRDGAPHIATIQPLLDAAEAYMARYPALQGATYFASMRVQERVHAASGVLVRPTA